MTPMTPMNRILILDDEASIGASLSFALEDQYEVSVFTEPHRALEEIRQELFHICLLDLKIGNVDGIDVLKQIKEIQPGIEVIIITAFGTIESSVKALQNGAFTYITKPINIDELIVNIERAFHYKQLNSQVEYLSKELEKKYRYEELIGKSDSMQRIYGLIDKVKDVSSTVLITGESGTGKELVARAIHYSGKRAKEPFEVLNCAAIPEQLLESELFGYEKGAFTGASGSRQGRFEVAQGGTIFLDEIGEMSPPLQAKLLRVLQKREISRLGSNRTIALDVRVITATNRDLLKAVRENSFREDLYFRINVIHLHLPPLRERTEDIPMLTKFLVEKFCQEQGTCPKRFSRAAEARLMSYSYPGNIRELGNIIESSLVMAMGDIIEIHDLPASLKDSGPVAHDGELPSLKPFVGMTLQQLQDLFIQETLETMDGHRRKTAEVLGISERNLRYRLNTPDKPEQP